MGGLFRQQKNTLGDRGGGEGAHAAVSTVWCNFGEVCQLDTQERKAFGYDGVLYKTLCLLIKVERRMCTSAHTHTRASAINGYHSCDSSSAYATVPSAVSRVVYSYISRDHNFSTRQAHNNVMLLRSKFRFRAESDHAVSRVWS